MELGNTDTDRSDLFECPFRSGSWLPGDAAYNDAHLYLAESNAQTRRDVDLCTARQIRVTQSARSCRVRIKDPKTDDKPRIIEETRQYIRDFDRLAEKTRTAQELYDKMLELYPNRVNPGWALWSSARAVKPPSQAAENAK